MSSSLFEEIRGGRPALRSVETVVRHTGFVADLKPDLQVAEVIPGFLYFGSQDVSSSWDHLQAHGITHALCAATGISLAFPDRIEYLQVDLLDLPDAQPVPFEAMNTFIEGARIQGGRVFVFCNAGISRSATVVMGYLIGTLKLDFDAAYARVKSARPCARPNHGFLRQLKVLATTADAS